jgi:ubiquinol-cytochrome c reductase cytochrome c subunit
VNRRLRPVPLVLGLTLLAVGVLGLRTADAAPVGTADEALREEGRELYLTGCSSCHGADGEGVTVGGELRGPSLDDAGEAIAHYYLSTGRMPLSDPTDQPRRKEPAYDEDEIAALVAYVASIGDGEELPDVDLADTDLAEGGVIYRVNCQACHSAFGSGGALSYGRAAPNLHRAEPSEVAAAVRGGPGQMPVFNEQQVDDDQLEDLIAYVEYLKDPVNEGGVQIGRNGPVPEGFVAWLFGIGGALLIVAWVGGRDPRRHRPEPQEHP